jgi:3D (Asp-Asp-Asp) domain-containing protein
MKKLTLTQAIEREYDPIKYKIKKYSLLIIAIATIIALFAIIDTVNSRASVASRASRASRAEVVRDGLPSEASEATTIQIKTTQIKTIQILTTMYSEFDSCHYENCAMASGKRAYIGAIACPRNWKLGTKVKINGKIYTCEDRYNKNLSDRLDIFNGYGQKAYDEAIQYGKQTIIVELIHN